MKKFIALLMVLLVAITLIGCTEQDTLRLYNWGEYIDDSLLEAFEENTGIRVEQILFDSNEVAVTQIKAGNQYDLVIPSDYAIEQLASENLIDPINWSAITTFDKDVDLADGLVSILDTLADNVNGFDLLEYAVPYFWGNLGILYDTTTVDENDLTGWDVLEMSDTYDIAFYNSSRDAYLIGLKATGVSTINNPTTSEFDAGTDWLNAALTANVAVQTDEIFDTMLDPAAYDLAVAYSGDANYLMSENDNLSFFVPNEGTNVFVDAFVTPKGANTVFAYQFINFMMDYDQALQNTEEVMYTTPRKDVFEDEIAVGGEFESLAASYDIRINANDEIYRYNAALKLQMDNSWQQILASKGYEGEGLGAGTIAIIVIAGVLVLGSIGLGAYRKFKKV